MLNNFSRANKRKEKEQKVNMSEQKNGTVKWFNSKKGYGFISTDVDGEKDVFVHASAVREAGLRFLNEGDKISFEIEDGDKGPSAVNLKKID